MKREDLKTLPTDTPVIVRVYGALNENYFPAIFKSDNGDYTYNVSVDSENWPTDDLGKYYPTLTVYADQIYRNIPYRFCRIPMKDSEVQMRTFRFVTDENHVTALQMKNRQTGEFEHIPRVQSFSIHCLGPRELPTITLETLDRLP